MHRAVFVLLSMLGALPSLCGAEARSRKDERIADLLSLERETSGLPVPERARRLDTYYRSTFSPLRVSFLDSLDESELRLMLRGVAMIAFYNPDASLSRDMEVIIGAMDRRGVTREDDRARYVQFLVGAREFGAAKRHSEASGGIATGSALPAVDEKAAARLESRGVLVPSVDGASLIPKTLPARDIEIVVVSSPLCVFSRAAMSAIAADAFLRNVMTRHGRWIMPVEGELHTERVRAWNADHPGMQMVYAYKESQWPFVDSWDTPTFYFMRAGKVVATHTGWRSDGDKVALTRLLAKLGILSGK